MNKNASIMNFRYCTKGQKGVSTGVRLLVAHALDL